MKIDIVIPSKGRVEKLTNCLNSIFMSARNTPINLYLYFSVTDELEYFKKFFQYIDEVKLKVVENYRVPDFWNGHMKETQSDVMMYLNDDVLLYDNTLELMKKKFEERGLDMVLGLSQANLPEDQALPGAFGVIGKEFMDRFPNREVFCKDYERFFIDKELMLFAQSVGQFHFDREIKIQHLHPLFGGKEDDTHKDVRKYIDKDRMTHRRRQALGYLWGKNFGLVNQ